MVWGIRSMAALTRQPDRSCETERMPFVHPPSRGRSRRGGASTPPLIADAPGRLRAYADRGAFSGEGPMPHPALPAIVSEGLVGLRHAVDVVFALVGVALLLDRIEQLVRELLRHRALATAASELDEPPHGEGARATRRHFDGHLVGRAADAARANLEHWGEGLDARLELLDGVLSGPLTQDGERVVDDLLGGRRLLVLNHLVDDLLDEAVAVNGVRLDRPDLGSGATGHYFAFTPYCERAFLRSPTPAASSVPRITL